MNNSRVARFYILSVFIILMSACAKMSVPTGGVRDRKPPVVLESFPVNSAKNFRGKKIEITFDEYVVLDNINDKFMVSPPMKKKPKVLIKGKSVVVEFEDKLKDSTTYTFYFQDAIRDLNESNILENYQFVFSTGPVIDSLSVTGNVYNALNLEVPEKTQVIMYREMADSAVQKHLPDYISQVDPYGYFRINNVRAGNYRLYALKDADNSKNYNVRDEEFAFMSTPVSITPEKNFIPVIKDTTSIIPATPKVPATAAVNKTVTNPGGATTTKKPVVKPVEPIALKGEYQLILFTSQKKAHYMTSSSRDINYLLTYTLSLPPDSMKFEFSIPGAGIGKYFLERSRNRDTLKVWLTDSTLYSQSPINTVVNYPFTDTLGKLGYKEDTIPMRYTAPRAPRGPKLKRVPFTFQSNLQAGQLKPGESIVFNSKTPFMQPDTSRIRIYELVETKKQRVPYHLAKDSSSSRRYILNAKLVPGKKYLFIADSASFANIYHEYSDSIGAKFNVREADSYSKITLDVKNSEGDRIIQLLNQQEKLVAQQLIKKDGKVVFPLLENAIYRVRVIYDLNEDGRWTTGDFEAGRQPEPVSYYFQELEIKTGRDLDQSWDTGILNAKDQKLREKPKTR